jgi:hypothetical protein
MAFKVTPQGLVYIDILIVKDRVLVHPIPLECTSDLYVV